MQIRCFLVKGHFLTLIMNGNLSASLSATSVYYGKLMEITEQKPLIYCQVYLALTFDI